MSKPLTGLAAILMLSGVAFAEEAQQTAEPTEAAAAAEDNLTSEENSASAEGDVGPAEATQPAENQPSEEVETPDGGQ